MKLFQIKSKANKLKYQSNNYNLSAMPPLSHIMTESEFYLRNIIILKYKIMLKLISVNMIYYLENIFFN